MASVYSTSRPQGQSLRTRAGQWGPLVALGTLYSGITELGTSSKESTAPRHSSALPRDSSPVGSAQAPLPRSGLSEHSLLSLAIPWPNPSEVGLGTLCPGVGPAATLDCSVVCQETALL